MKPSLLANTPSAGMVILVPMWSHQVEIQFQETDHSDTDRAFARQWLIQEGFIAFAYGDLKLDPQVTEYLETI